MRTGILLFILVLALPAASQHSQDLTLAWGGMNLRGDVGPTWSNPSQGNAWTLGYRYQGHPHYSVRLVAEQGEFTASDPHQADPTALPAE